MKLADLNQIIIVPINDEEKGATYEEQMSIADFFEKFFDGVFPETIEAIPIEWVKGYANALSGHKKSEVILDMLKAYRKVGGVEL
jgi:hypothetical protein